MPSKITKLISFRLKNDEIDAIDAMSELIGKSKSDTIRILLTPSIIQAKTAMETKSVVQAAKARLNAEIEQSKLIRDLAKKAEIQTNLNLGEYSYDLQPA
jgi:negative regulator of replication initiation